jgi:hypothetical protein
MRFLACPARFERATYALEEFVAVQKSIYFNGNDFGNKGVVLLQTLVLPIDMAETRGFEPPIHVLAQMLP